MYHLNGEKVAKVEATTFSELGMKESDLEEIVRNNVNFLCDEEESMLIIGQQVQNKNLGRSDLTAIDNNGNLVLIEIKRDKKDIEHRKEAFEFQAIRYVASYAKIKSVEDVVKKIYAPYIETKKKEFKTDPLTAYELGSRKLNDFLEINEAENTFNENQRIILIASEFDEQTLSAVAWLGGQHFLGQFAKRHFSERPGSNALTIGLG